jgi:hypothetical protein
MNRRHLQRISRAETLLSEALAARLEHRAQLKQRLPSLARNHAIVVAAMVLNGEPKITEPLLHTWTRTWNQHYSKQFDIFREFGRLNDIFLTRDGRAAEGCVERIDALVAHELQKNLQESPFGYEQAADKMVSEITGGPEAEATRFSEIFKTAPAWLLKFSFIRLDAKILKFDTPNLAAAPEFGELGLRDALRWPLLPLGTVAEGNPIAQQRDHSVSTDDRLFLLETLAKPAVQWTQLEWDRILALDLNRQPEDISDPTLLRIAGFTKAREVGINKLDFRQFIGQLPRQAQAAPNSAARIGNIIQVMAEWLEALECCRMYFRDHKDANRDDTWLREILEEEEGVSPDPPIDT